MSKKTSSCSQVQPALKEIEKEVIRVLGRQQANIITITETDTFMIISPRVLLLESLQLTQKPITVSIH